MTPWSSTRMFHLSPHNAIRPHPAPRNPNKVSKIVAALGLKIPPRDLKSTDTRALLTVIYSQWLPLSSCVAQAVIDVVPPPAVAQITRLPKMLSLDGHTPINSTEAAKSRSLMFGIGSESCLLAYVSKMFAVPEQYFSETLKRRGMAQLQSYHRTAADASANPGKNNIVISAGSLDHGPSDLPKEDDEVLLGFARLYSGTIRTGDRVFCVLPKYQNSSGAGASQQRSACRNGYRRGSLHNDGPRAASCRQCEGREHLRHPRSGRQSLEECDVVSVG